MGLRLLLAGVASLAVLAEAVTPIEKVIKLIEKLQAQSQEEGQAEAVAYDKFACFCKAQAGEKLHSIAKASEDIELLTARIEKFAGDINELNLDIKETQDKIKSSQEDYKTEEAARSKAYQAFLVERNDLAAALRETTEAIEMLENAGGSKASALLQEQGTVARVAGAVRASVRVGAMPMASSAETKEMTALLEFLDGEEPATYEFHAGAILEKLRDLMKKTKVKKNECEAEEADNKHTSDMAQGARANQIAALQDTQKKEEEQVAEKEEAKAADEASLEQTKTDKAADQSFLDALTTQCEDTAKAWNDRSVTRSNELMALSEALEILKGKVATKYGANKKLNLATQKQAVNKSAAPKGHWVWVADTFLQSASHVVKLSDDEQEAAAYLEKQSKKIKSTTLATLALKIRSGEDHFKKVRTMIKDMVAKLEADAEAESSQKEWCDDEMKKSMEKRDESIGKLEGAMAEITGYKATIDELAAKIQTLQAEVAELYTSKNEAVKLREAEKAENAKTVKDAEAGLKAVKAAINVLKDFYDKAALVQYTPPNADASGKTVGDLAPKVNTKSYSGNQAASTGIIGLMEVIESDFGGTIEATKSQEEKAETEFKKFEESTMATIKEKQESVKEAKKETSEAEDNLFTAKDDYKEQVGLKKDAIDELAKLKPACVSTGASHEEKVARREQEIESLKNAYTLLKDMSFLQRK